MVICESNKKVLLRPFIHNRFDTGIDKQRKKALIVFFVSSFTYFK